MRYALRWVVPFCALAWLTPFVHSQATRPIDDRQAIADVARAYIAAARALDSAAVTKLFAMTDDSKQQKAVTDTVWMIVQTQRLRLAAEKKFGPEPKPGVESDDWGWGILPVNYFDAALESEPTIIDLQGDAANVYAFGMYPLEKQADGRWLFAIDAEENAIEVPEDPKLKAALEKRFESILADIESGKIKSAGDVVPQIMTIFGG